MKSKSFGFYRENLYKTTSLTLLVCVGQTWVLFCLFYSSDNIHITKCVWTTLYLYCWQPRTLVWVLPRTRAAFTHLLYIESFVKVVLSCRGNYASLRIRQKPETRHKSDGHTISKQYGPGRNFVSVHLRTPWTTVHPSQQPNKSGACALAGYRLL